MNVLSLFDGISCGQIALRELGITPAVYYASEINKHAIKQTQHNFPNTVQLGDVERWQEWAIDWEKIDLVLAGSPCQGFSFSGLQLAFDDPRSRLFFVFVDILNHIRKFNPGVKFLLENVNMKRSYLGIISKYCGILPVAINSDLVSAQTRKRYYWTNIRTRTEGMFNELYTDIPQPKDRGIVLRDIIDDEVAGKYYISTIATEGDAPRPQKETTVIYQLPRGDNRGGEFSEKAPTLTANCWERNNILMTNNYAQWDVSGKGYKPQQYRAFYANSKHGALCTARAEDKNGVLIDNVIRRLTPGECAKLQTIPSWYEWVVSETQIYQQLGNGWTIEVIKHILSYLNNETTNYKTA